MKLICTILVGSHDSNLPRAFHSIAPHVDEVILIDTAPELARNLCAVSDSSADLPANVEMWPWQGRFDAARNEALALATEADGTWAITLDADEWYVNASGLRDLCASASPDVEVIHLRNGEASRYYQPRVIRLPCSRRWVGRTHEAIDFGGVRLKNDEIRFCSSPKTPEQVAAKSLRDLPLLLEEVAEKPEEGRWFYYLGNTYANLADGLDGSDPLWGEAIDAYLKAATLGRNREDNALAYYRAANILVLKRLEYKVAIEMLMHAMSEHAGLPELPLLAGWASLRLASSQPTEQATIACVQQALYLAQLAQVHGEGSFAIKDRVQHIDPEAATVGPLRLMAECFKLGGATERELECLAKIAEMGD